MRLSVTLRACKTALVCCIGLFCVLVGTNNLIDYDSNFQFVKHVMSMDTVFAGSILKSRAITSPLLHQLAYGCIILCEFLIGILCLWGAARMLKQLRRSAQLFHGAKSLAVLGLSLGFVLWFLGFMTIGGEWFLMWQSQQWNAQQPVFRILVCFSVVLLLLVQRDDD